MLASWRDFLCLIPRFEVVDVRVRIVQRTTYITTNYAGFMASDIYNMWCRSSINDSLLCGHVVILEYLYYIIINRR